LALLPDSFLLPSRNAPMTTKLKYAIVMPFENQHGRCYKDPANHIHTNGLRVNIYYSVKRTQKLNVKFQYSIKRSILAYPILYCFKIPPKHVLRTLLSIRSNSIALYLTIIRKRYKCQ
jgi:hypothetical protein